MPKIKNKLYSNPKNAYSHEIWTEAFLMQPLRVGDKKFGTYAICNVHNFYLNNAVKAEEIANQTLNDILKKIRTSEKDLDIVDKIEWKKFMENAINTIVWSYSAIEWKVNSIIECKASDKKKDKYLRMDLAEKLKNVMPTLCQKEKLSRHMWDRFHNLDTIRHSIIHTKSSYWMQFDKWEETIPYKLYNWIFKWCVKTAHEIIEYFTIKVINKWPCTLTVERGMSSFFVKK